MIVIKIFASLAALFAIGLGAFAAAIYFNLTPVPGPILNFLSGAKGPEHSARFYPPDTMAYAWLTLAPGGGQLDDSRDIWDRFNQLRTFRRILDNIEDDMEQETGIDFRKDVMPWVGPDLSAGFIDFDFRRQEPFLAATIGVRDREAAADFLDDWLDYLEDEENADFDRDTYRDFDIWFDASEYQTYGLSNDILVFATTEKALEEIIDGISGNIDRSLADSEHFRAARAALPKRRFSSLYVDTQETLEFASELSEVDLDDLDIAALDNWRWISASAAWFDHALVVEAITPSGIEQPLEFPNLEVPSQLMPEDTVAFVAGTFDPNIEKWRDALRHYDISDLLSQQEIEDFNDAAAEIEYYLDTLGLPTLSLDSSADETIDRVLDLLYAMTGINFETEFLNYLTGQIAVSLGDTDFSAVEDDPMANPVNMVMMLPYHQDSRDGLSDTMDQVVNLIADNTGMRPDDTDINAGSDARIYDGEDTYTPGYVLHGGRLIIGTTKESLVDSVALHEDGTDSLETAPEYRRLVDHLPETSQFRAYIDLNRITQHLEHDHVYFTYDGLDVIQTSLGRFAVSIYLPHCINPPDDTFDCEIAPGDDYNRTTAVLTLFPE